MLIEGFLGGVFWVGLDSLVIALLPLTLLGGSKISGWSRATWALMYAAALFAFIHILLSPGTGYVSETSRSPFTVSCALFIAFSLFSFAFGATSDSVPPVPANRRRSPPERTGSASQGR